MSVYQLSKLSKKEILKKINNGEDFFTIIEDLKNALHQRIRNKAIELQTQLSITAWLLSFIGDNSKLYRKIHNDLVGSCFDNNTDWDNAMSQLDRIEQQVIELGITI
jgi:hypothetical protein